MLASPIRSRPSTSGAPRWVQRLDGISKRGEGSLALGRPFPIGLRQQRLSRVLPNQVDIVGVTRIGQKGWLSIREMPAMKCSSRNFMHKDRTERYLEEVSTVSNYDLSSLFPIDFEHVVRDLLQEEESITLETFAAGRDSLLEHGLRRPTMTPPKDVLTCANRTDLVIHDPHRPHVASHLIRVRSMVQIHLGPLASSTVRILST